MEKTFMDKVMDSAENDNDGAMLYTIMGGLAGLSYYKKGHNAVESTLIGIGTMVASGFVANAVKVYQNK